MSDITLEKIDIIRERAGVTYAKAKEVLEINEGNIVDSMIYIESNSEDKEKKIYSTLDELTKWLKGIINKGNINRIRIKKEDKVLVDVPVNASIAAGVIATVWQPLIAIGLATATLTTVTVEITKEDGATHITLIITSVYATIVALRSGFIWDDVQEAILYGCGIAMLSMLILMLVVYFRCVEMSCLRNIFAFRQHDVRDFIRWFSK